MYKLIIMYICVLLLPSCAHYQKNKQEILTPKGERVMFDVDIPTGYKTLSN